MDLDRIYYLDEVRHLPDAMREMAAEMAGLMADRRDPQDWNGCG